MSRLAAVVVSVSLLACGGGSPVTQIVVAVDTNLCLEGELSGRPAEYDRIDLEVLGDGADGGSALPATRCAVFGRAQSPCVSNPSLPLTLAVVRDRATRRVTVTARASLAGTPVAVRTLETDFVADQSRLLQIRLTRSCVPPGCGPDPVATVPLPSSVPPFLGCGISQPVPQPPFQAIAAGSAHACLLDDDDVPYCWGFSTALFDTSNSPCAKRMTGQATNVLQMALGGVHSCFLRTGNQVVCMGGGSAGQLGNGLFFESACCVPVMGEDGASMVAAGAQYSCVLVGGEILCFGRLGTSGTAVGTATAVPMAPTGLSAMDIGDDHACVLAGTGLHCFGSNAQGQLGTGMVSSTTLPPTAVTGSAMWTAVATGVRSTCGLAMPNGQVYCWGENRFPGSLGWATAGGAREAQPAPRAVGTLQATAIGAGDGFHCALSATNTLSCWGLGDEGQLGNGSMEASVEPVTVLGGPYRAVAVGGNFACALPADTMELPRCWGYNASGQLANGTFGEGTGSGTPETILLCD